MQDCSDHLIQLSDRNWALWQTVCLRGAGFPVSLVLKLATPQCAELADILINCEKETEQQQHELQVYINKELDLLKQHGQWNDREARMQLVDTLRNLKKDITLKPLIKDRSMLSLWESCSQSYSRKNQIKLEFQQAFDIEKVEIEANLFEIAKMNLFQEAVTWQNRQACKTSIEWLVLKERGKPGGSRLRQTHELIANYLQRYCTKNDSIGFFGPLGWAEFMPDGENISLKLGQKLLAARKVYFEDWGIRTLVESSPLMESLRPWCAPRLMPYIYFNGNELVFPGGAIMRLSSDDLLLVNLCNGKRTAIQIADELLLNGEVNYKGRAAIIEQLHSLDKLGVIKWIPEISVQINPEQALRELVEGVGDEQVYKNATAIIDELETARNNISNSAGDAQKLDQSLDNLEKIFSSYTGEQSTREAGKTYAGRTLVYEDCRRDVTLTIGPDIIKQLDSPLCLLLSSARWLTSQLAQDYRKIFQEVYDDLSKINKSSTVNAVDFWMKVDPLLYDSDLCIGKSVIPLFQERWREILKPDLTEKWLNYSSHQLRHAVGDLFKAESPGWPQARYHCPDVMIAASSVDDINRGDYQLVMGELHLGVNTINSASFLEQHPSPENLYKAIDIDCYEKRLVPVTPKGWGDLTTRTGFGHISAHWYRLLIGGNAFDPGKYTSSSNILSIGSMIIEVEHNKLYLKTRNGHIKYDLLEGFGEFLSSIIINYFSILPQKKHTPRISIDRLVVCRETWRQTCSEMNFAFEAQEGERFLAARRWQKSYGLPRFLFVKAPTERKPFYLDLDSPIYVNLLAKAVRSVKESKMEDTPITLTEMLPNHEESWLIDNSGERYTCELRMVALDLNPFKTT